MHLSVNGNHSGFLVFAGQMMKYSAVILLLFSAPALLMLSCSLSHLLYFFVLISIKSTSPGRGQSPLGSAWKMFSQLSTSALVNQERPKARVRPLRGLTEVTF